METLICQGVSHSRTSSYLPLKHCTLVSSWSRPLRCWKSTDVQWPSMPIASSSSMLILFVMPTANIDVPAWLNSKGIRVLSWYNRPTLFLFRFGGGGGGGGGGGVCKYCCSVYGTVWCKDEVRSANCVRTMLRIDDQFLALSHTNRWWGKFQESSGYYILTAISQLQGLCCSPLDLTFHLWWQYMHLERPNGHHFPL